MYPKPLQMAVLVVAEKQQEMEYPVRVNEVLKKTILIDAPLDENNYPKRLPTGTLLRLKYVIGHAMYHFDSHSIQNVKEDVPLLAIDKPKPEQINRVQRRSYFRVPVMLDAVIQPETEAGGSYKAALVELSGGGFSFRLEEHVAVEGEGIVGTLLLPLGGQEVKVRFRGEVRRVDRLERMKAWHYGLEFDLITDQDRETVMQYCFERQRQLRRKGMLASGR